MGPGMGHCGQDSQQARTLRDGSPPQDFGVKLRPQRKEDWLRSSAPGVRFGIEAVDRIARYESKGSRAVERGIGETRETSTDLGERSGTI